jgi:hypothetical protein
LNGEYIRILWRPIKIAKYVLIPFAVDRRITYRGITAQQDYPSWKAHPIIIGSGLKSFLVFFGVLYLLVLLLFASPVVGSASLVRFCSRGGILAVITHFTAKWGGECVAEEIDDDSEGLTLHIVTLQCNI